MLHSIIIAMLVLAIVLPIGIFYLGELKAVRFKRSLAVNIISFFGMLLVGTVFIFSGSAQAAESAPQSVDGLRYVGAALSTGLASIGAGIATGQAASAALGALSENEGIMGKALIFVALAEGIAIYGLVISIMILMG